MASSRSPALHQRGEGSPRQCRRVERVRPRIRTCLDRIPRCINLLPTGNPMPTRKTAFAVLLALISALPTLAQTTPKLTLDDFFNSVSFRGLEISPDGNSVVVETDRADWDQQIFRTDLWLYQADGKAGSLIQLTQSGHDSDPKRSPAGKGITF